MADKITVEVVLALPGVQHLRRIAVPRGCTVGDAIARSGLAAELPHLTAAGLFGVWGKKVTADTVLQADERVEIYRPLLMDPKAARRVRAQQKQRHDAD